MEMNDAVTNLDMSKFMSPGAPLVEGGRTMTVEEEEVAKVAALDPPAIVVEPVVDPAASVDPAIDPEVVVEPVVEPVIPTPPVVVAEPEEDGGPVKLTDGSWEIRVKVEGRNDQVYTGRTKGETVKKVIQAQENATRKIAQQERVIKARKEVVLEPEKLEPLALSEVRDLSPDERFTLTQDIQDPAKITAAYKRLQEADPSYVRQQNEVLLKAEEDRSRFETRTWVNNSGFVTSKENMEALSGFFQRNGWRVTEQNLNAAVAKLEEIGEIENPYGEEDIPAPATAPVAVVPAVPAVPAAPPVAAAPASALPATTPQRVLRPGSGSTSIPRGDQAAIIPAAPVVPKVVLTADEYRKLPSSETKKRYRADAEFRAAVDLLIKNRQI